MNRKKTVVILAFLVFFLLPAAVLSAYQLAFWQKIYFGVRVAGRELSGLDRPKAAEIIEKNILSAGEEDVCLQSEGSRWCFSGRDVGLRYLPSASAEKAFGLGRNRGFVENWRKRVRLLAEPANLDLLFDLDRPRLDSYIASAASQLNQPFLPPVLESEGGLVRVVPGRQGRRLDREELVLAVKRQLGQLSFGRPINITLTQTGESYSFDQLEKGRARGQRLITKNLLLTSPRENFVISGEQLLGFVGFGRPWNKNRVADYVADLSKQVNRPAQDALFGFEEGRVTVFSLEKNGWRLDEEKTARDLTSCLDRLEKPGVSRCLAEMSLLRIKPKITSGETNRLGIRELVGRGESFFSGSPRARVDNIALAAKKLNGQLVPPGEAFSFNRAVGEISRKTGYKSTYIISNGRTVLGDGGGVCQVSTTLFRAALSAGLPILERHAHAYRVHYYEENSLVGMDATIFSPSVDLRFRNDLESHILIQTSFDRKNSHLVFEFFGARDGRKTEIYNHRVWGRTPPPEDLYVDDPDLPLGVVKQVDWRAWGAKAAFDWKVTRNGKLIHKQSFFSYYRPWQAVFMRGTRTSP